MCFCKLLKNVQRYSLCCCCKRLRMLCVYHCRIVNVNVCKCIHVHTYTHIHGHTHSHTHSYVRMCVHTHTHVYACICMQAHKHTHTHTHTHTPPCFRVFLYENYWYLRSVIYSFVDVFQLDYVERPSWQAQISGQKTWQLVPSPECEAICHSFNVTVHKGDISMFCLHYFVCVCVCVYVCVWECVYMFVCVWVSVCVYVYEYVCFS